MVVLHRFYCISLLTQEDKQWMSLCERLSERCYIIGDRVHHRPGLLKDEELLETFKTSGVVYNMEQMTTLSDLMECAKKMEGKIDYLLTTTK